MQPIRCLLYHRDAHFAAQENAPIVSTMTCVVCVYLHYLRTATWLQDLGNGRNMVEVACATFGDL
eukprot:3079831-Amphidinium_carterae.1